VAESFFATLECELPDCQRTFRNRTNAKVVLFDDIEGFYNPTRRHSSLGNVTPARFETDDPAA
jgi:putative transposase